MNQRILARNQRRMLTRATENDYDDSFVRAAASRLRNSAWPRWIFSRARGRGNHAARSTSGNSAHRPERGGHSILNVLLTILSGSTSASAMNA